MSVDKNCKKCLKKTYSKLLKKYPMSNCQIFEFTEFFNELMYKCEDKSSPEIQRELSHKLSRLIGVDDLFEDEKQESNKIALQLYEEWKPQVLDSDNPFNLALRLAIAGNIMDYGSNQKFSIQDTIKKMLHSNFAIDHSIVLKRRIKEAKNILYLGDNAGEIVFDKLLIETFMHPDVTYVVKSGPAINDVTMLDAEAIGMDIAADVVSNGFDAPSTILQKSSSEFRCLFESADLIISKGQGNFEGLMTEKDPRIFFLLTVKCEVIAKLLNVKKRGGVVFNQSV